MFEKKPSKTTSHLSEKGVWRNVTMVTKFLDHNNTELSNDDREGNENGKKMNSFILAKNSFARASRFSVHFLAVLARLRHETS